MMANRAKKQNIKGLKPFLKKEESPTEVLTENLMEVEADKFFDKVEVRTSKVEIKQIDPFPDRPTLRISEVAKYYDVTERTVYLWVDHGHLDIEFTPGGQKRITKESVNKCRFARKQEEMM